MSDSEGAFDPDKDVPQWVNIVVPIMCGVIFVAVLVILYRTKKEIPIEKLERWAGKLPLLSNCFSTEWKEYDEEKAGASKTKPWKPPPGAAVYDVDETTKLTHCNDAFSFGSCDTISAEKSEFTKSLDTSDTRRTLRLTRSESYSERTSGMVSNESNV